MYVPSSQESDPANEYDDSDWEDFDEEATDDESEDDEPTSISALESMSGAALYDPVLSPQRSKVNKKVRTYMYIFYYYFIAL